MKTKIFISRIWKDILALAIFAITSVIVFQNNSWIHAVTGDVTGYHLLPFQLIYNSLTQFGELPLWMANLWGGMTGIHNINFPFAPLIYLLMWPFLGESGDLIGFQFVEFVLIVHIFLLQVGMYAILRQIKLSRLSCVAGTLIGAVSISLLCYLGWFNMVISMCYAPAIIAGLVWVCDEAIPIFGKRNIVLAILFASALCLELAQPVVTIALMWGILYLFYVLEYFRNWKELIRITGKIFISGILGIALAAVAFVPTYLLGLDNTRGVPGVGYLTSADKIPFANFIEHGYAVNTLRNLLGGGNVQLSLTVIAILLVILGLFVKPKNSKQRILSNFSKFVSAFAVIGGLGLCFPDILYYIPFGNQIREPFLYGMVLFVGAGVLCGLATEGIVNAVQTKDWREWFYNPKLAMFLVIIVSGICVLPHNLTVYSGITFVAMILFCVYVFVSAKKNIPVLNRIVPALLIVALCANSILETREVLGTSAYTAEKADSQMVSMTEQNNHLFEKTEYATSNNMFRISEYATLPCLPTNAAVYMGCFSTVNYWNPMYGKNMDRHIGLELGKRMQLENVKYWLVQEADTYINPESLNFAKTGVTLPVFNDYNVDEMVNVNVYKNCNYAGPAWFVYDVVFYEEGSEASEIYEIINAPEFDVLKSVVISDKDLAVVENITPGEFDWSVEDVVYTGNTISLSCSTEAEGLLLLTESDAPGWKATIDGEPVEIISVDYERKGIVVPAGSHTVSVVYCPNELVIGAGITTVSILFICVYSVISLCRKRRKSASYIEE